MFWDGFFFWLANASAVVGLVTGLRRRLRRWRCGWSAGSITASCNCWRSKPRNDLWLLLLGWASQEISAGR